MKSKDRQLLLIDLCGRLPYEVKGLHRGETQRLLIMDSFGSYQVNGYDAWFDLNSVSFKPYLFPLSSITKKTLEELSEYIDIKNAYVAVELLNSHHIDYRGLIEKGLAIDATGLNIY